MQAMRWLILMIAVLFVDSWSWAAEKTLTVAFGKGRPPYVFFEEGRLRGIEVDLAREC